MKPFQFIVTFEHINSRGFLMAESVVYMTIEATTQEIAQENLERLLKPIKHKRIEYEPVTGLTGI